MANGEATAYYPVGYPAALVAKEIVLDGGPGHVGQVHQLVGAGDERRIPHEEVVVLELVDGLGEVGPVGLDVASDQVETPADVVAMVEQAMKHVPKERLVLCTNCGMAPMKFDIAVAKLEALGKGAALAREKFA